MATKNFLKKFLLISVTVIFTVTLVGCFDLGDYSDEQEYYESFGAIRLVYQNPESAEKDIKFSDYGVRDYFYNENTGEDFTYGDPNDSEPDEGKNIPKLSYLYMAIPISRDVKIDSLALYFNSEQDGNLRISVYVVDDLPDNGNFSQIKLFGDPETQEKEEDGEIITEPIIYTDPSDEDLVASTTAHLKKDHWDSIVVERWKGEDFVQIKKSQYILLRFVNNGALRAEGEVVMNFKTTNLLIRAIS